MDHPKYPLEWRPQEPIQSDHGSSPQSVRTVDPGVPERITDPDVLTRTEDIVDSTLTSDLDTLDRISDIDPTDRTTVTDDLESRKPRTLIGPRYPGPENGPRRPRSNHELTQIWDSDVPYWTLVPSTPVRTTTSSGSWSQVFPKGPRNQAPLVDCGKLVGLRPNPDC